MDSIQPDLCGSNTGETTLNTLDEGSELDKSNRLSKRRRIHRNERLYAPYELDWGDLELVRCEELWFDDGNIVIRVLAKPSASNLPPTLAAFKCHRSILASKSEFFRVMFGLPQDTTSQPTVDGVPSVDFLDDFEELRDFLKFLYEMEASPILDLPEVGEECDPFPLISGVLHLAVKYDVPVAARLLYDHLQSFWPRSWPMFRHIESWARRYATEEIPDPQHKWVGPAHVVLFAEKHKIGGMMNFAWYDLARFPARGSAPRIAPHIGRTVSQLRTVDLDLLEDDHLRRLVVGRERLRDLLVEQIDGMDAYIERHRKKHADDPCECIGRLAALWKRATTGQRLLVLTRDPLGEFVKLSDHVDNMARLQAESPRSTCTCCYTWLLWRINGVVEEIWGKLPQIFEFA